MCVSAVQCDARSAPVETRAAPPAEDVVRVSTRVLPLINQPSNRHIHRKVYNESTDYCDRKSSVNYNNVSIAIAFQIRLQNIDLGVHFAVLSSAVVFVVVSLCVRRTACALHARTSLDTAPSHHLSLYLAALCVLLTVTTRCYAFTAISGSQTLAQTSQTLSQASTSSPKRLHLVQSVPSSIARPRISFSRNYFVPKRKSGRLKRTSTDQALLLDRSGNGVTAGDQHGVVNVSDTTGNLTNNGVGSVTSASVGLNSSGPVRKQSTVRPMPSAHDEPTHTVSDDIGGGIETGGGTASGGGSDTGGGNRFLALVISAALLTVTLGFITCLVNCYRDSAGTAGSIVQQHSLVPVLAAEQHHIVTQPITAPMLSVVSASAAGMDAGGGGAAGRLHRHVTRELAVQRDRQVRLHSVHTDLELDLPPSIALPDGEELPYGSSARLHIRDPEQESEIYQKCIRPPPNRTVFESESPPPYRSSSAGLLGSLAGSTSSNSTAGVSDWSTGSSPFVVRCHSMSSTSTTTTTNKRTLEPQQATSTLAPGTASASTAAAATAGGQKTDFLQRTVKIFTGKKNTSPLPQPAPTLPVVVVPTAGVRTPRRLAEHAAPTRAKHQGNV